MEIKGKFTKIIFNKAESGYTVALFELSESQQIEDTVVVGYIDHLNKEDIYLLEGKYIDHPKYGIQFNVDSYSLYITPEFDNLVRYFSSFIFKGIGKKYATTLVDTLGLDLIDRIKEDNDILDQVEKMNKKRKDAILSGLQTSKNDDMFYLKSNGLSENVIYMIKNTYGDDFMAVLISNPYQVIRDINGVGFKTMDKFALSIGIDENDRRRMLAYSEAILDNMCMRNGDSYVNYQDYYQELCNNIDDDVGEIIDTLIKEMRIVNRNNEIFSIAQFKSQQYIAQFLAGFPYQSINPVAQQTIDSLLDSIQNKFNIKYEGKQLEAIKAFFSSNLLILTGGPGTGKTTIVKGMLEICNQLYPQYNTTLIAPTGRAAKRLSELTNYTAKTIHSLLLWDKETGRFAKDEKEPLNLDILIIDEFSMVDQYLFYNLLKASKSMKKLVIIGDVDQLPSVAPGAVLRDLIDSELFTTIKLNKIYRQSEGSDIISLANDIKNDCCQEIPTDKDIRFFTCEPKDIKTLTLQVVSHALNNYADYTQGFMNVQVLAPKHAGLNGINNLNVALQKEFNPYSSKKKELKVGAYHTYRVYDKILQLKNQPDDDVFNGDIGIITDIIHQEEDIEHKDRIIADFDGRMVEYTSDEFINITHGYCISVHKAQGSEYPIIIMPLDMDYRIMLQKRLIYTAVTRAYKSLIFVGEKQAFYQGIKTKEHFIRKTRLKEELLAYYEQVNATD